MFWIDAVSPLLAKKSFSVFTCTWSPMATTTWRESLIFTTMAQWEKSFPFTPSVTASMASHSSPQFRSWKSKSPSCKISILPFVFWLLLDGVAQPQKKRSDKINVKKDRWLEFLWLIIEREVDENYRSVLLFMLFWNVVKYYLYFSLREAYDQK